MDIDKAGKLYRQNSLLAISTEKFLLWILDEIYKALKMGKEAMAVGDIAEKNKQIQICQQLMLEIIPMINNSTVEGKKLVIVIDYMNRRLIKANISSQIFILEEIEDLLIDLHLVLKEIVGKK